MTGYTDRYCPYCRTYTLQRLVVPRHMRQCCNCDCTLPIPRPTCAALNRQGEKCRGRGHWLCPCCAAIYCSTHAPAGSCRQCGAVCGPLPTECSCQRRLGQPMCAYCRQVAQNVEMAK